MTCTKPLDAFRVKGGAVVVVERGGRAPHNATTRTAFQVPCGKCIGCRMENARQWGIRCLHEAKCWHANSYVTLTYATENLPPGGSLCLRDVQLFMKRLRIWQERVYNRLTKPEQERFYPNGPKIRFFVGGEYGETNGRPHYHALLFNVGFRDRVLFGRNHRGEALYTSATLSKLWSRNGSGLGFCTIGDVTYDSAIYCAKYALKKVNGKQAEDYYCVYDSDGVCHDRDPEWAVQSTRPGIGAYYYAAFGDEVRNWDNVIVDGKPCRPPRFYDRCSEKMREHDETRLACPCELCRTKRDRKRKAVANRGDNTPERLEVKQRLMVIAAEKKERKL